MIILYHQNNHWISMAMINLYNLSYNNKTGFFFTATGAIELRPANAIELAENEPRKKMGLPNIFC